MLPDSGARCEGWLGLDETDTAPSPMRRELRELLRVIVRKVLAGHTDCRKPVDALVVQMVARLQENRSEALYAAHDHSGRRGLASHMLGVAMFMMNLSDHCGWSDEFRHELGVAGLLHDIGKLAIPLSILDKLGKLEAHEMECIRRHTGHGVDMLGRSGLDTPLVRAVCLHHHERLDGSGYPHGLSGDTLTLAIRVSSICDVYDALISKRSYKTHWNCAQALDEMRAPAKFDLSLLDAFAHSIAPHSG